MTIKLPRLKVRPRALAQASPCAGELSAMLGCWAASSDKMNTNDCRLAALALENCMANNAGRKGKVRKPTINYRVSKWSRIPRKIVLTWDQTSLRFSTLGKESMKTTIQASSLGRTICTPYAQILVHPQR